jgi:CRP-like cAMP-binding protein
MRHRFPDLNLADHPVLRGVSPEALARLCAAGTTRVAPAGQVLLEQGSESVNLVLLLRGSLVAESSSTDGSGLMVALLRAPAVGGEAALLGVAAPSSLIALERSVVFEVPIEIVAQAIAESPAFGQNLVRDLASKLSGAIERQRSMAFQPVEARVAELLLLYLEVYGLPVPDGTLIRIKLSQEDLAQALGVTRRSVTRALKAWTDGGALTKRGGRFVVRDEGPLLSAAGAAAPARAGGG